MLATAGDDATQIASLIEGVLFIIGWVSVWPLLLRSDFASVTAESGVVSATGGITALIAAKILGPRLGYPEAPELTSPLAATIVASVNELTVEEKENGSLSVGYGLSFCKKDGSDFSEEEVESLKDDIKQGLEGFMTGLADAMGFAFVGMILVLI